MKNPAYIHTAGGYLSQSYGMYVRSVSDSVFSGAAGERDRHARENERVSLRNEENHVLIGFTQLYGAFSHQPPVEW